MNPPKKRRLNTAPENSFDRGTQSMWECPICLVVPPKEIYQCSNGHSMCSLCMSHVKKCPSCRIVIGRRKIRNYGLEQALDLLKLKCSWNGCNQELSREVISEHENHCLHNPNLILWCRFMHKKIKCNFRFTMESLEDAQKVEQFIEHMGTHQCGETKTRLGERWKSFLCIDRFKSREPNSATKYRQGIRHTKRILSIMKDNKKHLFMELVWIYTNAAGEEVLSAIIVQLTPNLRLQASPFKVKFSMTSQPRAEDILKWGPECAATITWTVKPILIKGFMYDCERSTADQLSFPSPIPMSHLESYYLDENRDISYEYYFTTV